MTFEGSNPSVSVRTIDDLGVDRFDDRPESTKSGRLQGALRDAIRRGVLRSGDRLPSTRQLAKDLGCSRNVTVEAYDQLGIEGYLDSRVGFGTIVTSRPQRNAPAHASPAAQRDTTPVIDLSPGLPDLAAFPQREWRRATRDSLDRMTVEDLGYTAQSAARLRVELSAYLDRVRATSIDPDRMVITSGVSAALGLVARTLGGGKPFTVAVEEPGAYGQRAALRAAGAELELVPVDDEGIRVDRLSGDVGVVVVTPAHQYPMGGILSPRRRNELVEWALSTPDRLIIEDDYDAEFRHHERPIGSIQGTAPDVVAITNSLSKTIAPALRIGWIALPPRIAAVVTERSEHEFNAPDNVQQHALAHLIGNGDYERIIRRRRRTYRSRHDQLAACLADIDGCTTVGAAAGIHMTLLLDSQHDDRAISARLADRGIRVPPLSDYRELAGPPGLVVSYAGVSSGAITTFADTLAELL